jgi:hypothetical protein
MTESWWTLSNTILFSNLSFQFNTTRKDPMLSSPHSLNLKTLKDQPQTLRLITHDIAVITLERA